MTEVLTGSRITVTIDDNHGGAITGLQVDGTHVINSLTKGRCAQFGLKITDQVGTRFMSEAGVASAAFADSTNSVLSVLGQDSDTLKVRTQLGYAVNPTTTAIGDVSLSNTTVTKSITVDFNGYDNLVLLTTIYKLGASTKLGSAELLFGMAPVDTLSRVHIINPTISSEPVLAGSISNAQVSGDAGVIYSSPDGQLALGVYSYNQKPHSITISTTNTETGDQFATKAGRYLASQLPSSAPGLNTTTYRYQQLLIAGTYEEVVNTMQVVMLASVSGNSTGQATTLSVEIAPTQVIPGNVFEVFVQALTSSGKQSSAFFDNVTISGNGPGTLSGTLTRAAVAGVAHFDDLEVDATGEYTLTVTSTTLTPAATSLTAIVAPATLLSVTPNAFLDTDTPIALSVSGFGFTYPLTATFSDGTDVAVPTGSATSFNVTSPALVEDSYTLSVTLADSVASNDLALTVGTSAPPVPVADTYVLVTPNPATVPVDTKVYVAAVDTAQFALGDTASIDTSYVGSVTLTVLSAPADSSALGPFVIAFVNGIATIPLGTLTADGLYTVQTDATLTQATGTFTTTNPQVVLTNIAPSSGDTDSQDVTLTITGSFIPETTFTARANGTPLITTYVNSTTATAVLPGSFKAVAGTVLIDAAVTNSPGVTNTLPYTVGAVIVPATTIQIVSVPTTLLSDNLFVVRAHILDASGALVTSFSDNCTMTEDGGDLFGTNVVAASGGVVEFVDMSISSATLGTKTIRINATGLTEASTTIDIYNPVPTLIQVNPVTYDTGSVPAQLDLVGTDFKAGMTLTITGVGAPEVEACVSITSTTAESPVPTMATLEGTYSVTVSNTDSTGESNPIIIEVTADPAPSVTADSLAVQLFTNNLVAPKVITVAVAAFDSSYVAGDIFGIDSTYVGSVTLTAVKPDGSSISGLGTTAFTDGIALFTLYTIYDGDYVFTATSNEALGTVDSNTLSLTNPEVVIGGLTPPAIDEGSGDTVIEVTSANDFPPDDATILLDGTPLTTTVVNTKTLSATVPASALVNPGTLAVSVEIENGPSPTNELQLVVTDIPDPVASSEEELPVSILVTPTTWQRFRPTVGPVNTSASPLRDAIRDVGTSGQVFTEAEHGVPALEVIEVEAGAYYSLLFSGSNSADDSVSLPVNPTLNAPLVIRAATGHSVAITPSEIRTSTLQFTSTANNRHIHWYNISVLSTTQCVKTDRKTLASTGAIVGDTSQRYSGLQFTNCSMLGLWDLRVVTLDADHFLVAPITSVGQTQYDANGDVHVSPLTIDSLDDVWYAINNNTYLDGVTSFTQSGRAFFPGDPTDPAHPNYDARLSPLYPTEAATPGLDYSSLVGSSLNGVTVFNAWDFAMPGCRVINFQNNGIDMQGVGSEYGVSSVAFNGFGLWIERCGFTGIKWETSARNNPLGNAGLDYSLPATDHLPDTGGIGFGTISLEEAFIQDNGYNSNAYQIDGRGHAGTTLIMNCVVRGGYSAELAHKPLMAGGGIRIADPQMFSNGVLNHYYPSLLSQSNELLVPWSDVLLFAGASCSSPTVIGTSAADFVCIWPYLAGSDVQNGQYLATYASSSTPPAGAALISGLQQNGTVVAYGNTFDYNRPGAAVDWAVTLSDQNPLGVVADRAVAHFGGIRSLTLDDNAFTSSSSNYGLSIDPTFNGVHLSSLTKTITNTNVLNTIGNGVAANYGGSEYEEALLIAQLQGEDPLNVPDPPPLPDYVIPLEADCEIIVDGTTNTFEIVSGDFTGLPITGGPATGANPVGSYNGETNLLAIALNQAVASKTVRSTPLGRIRVGLKGNVGTIQIATNSSSFNSSPEGRVLSGINAFCDNLKSSAPYITPDIGQDYASGPLDLIFVGLDADAQLGITEYAPSPGQVANNAQAPMIGLELYNLKLRMVNSGTTRYLNNNGLTEHLICENVEFLPLDPTADGRAYMVTGYLAENDFIAIEDTDGVYRPVFVIQKALNSTQLLVAPVESELASAASAGPITYKVIRSEAGRQSEATGFSYTAASGGERTMTLTGTSAYAAANPPAWDNSTCTGGVWFLPNGSSTAFYATTAVGAVNPNELTVKDYATSSLLDTDVTGVAETARFCNFTATVLSSTNGSYTVLSSGVRIFSDLTVDFTDTTDPLPVVGIDAVFNEAKWGILLAFYVTTMVFNNIGSSTSGMLLQEHNLYVKGGQDIWIVNNGQPGGLYPCNTNRTFFQIRPEPGEGGISVRDGNVVIQNNIIPNHGQNIVTAVTGTRVVDGGGVLTVWQNVNGAIWLLNNTVLNAFYQAVAIIDQVAYKNTLNESGYTIDTVYMGGNLLGVDPVSELYVNRATVGLSGIQHVHFLDGNQVQTYKSVGLEVDVQATFTTGLNKYIQNFYAHDGIDLVSDFLLIRRWNNVLNTYEYISSPTTQLPWTTVT